jgi:protein-L-isoaspartate(D-aspartate) O-methyltransferase
VCSDGEVDDDRVRAAFAAVDRRRFLPRHERRFADLDRPLPIGHDQTNSQPRTVADMLELLEVQPGQRVLDVGSGSGWTTALLAQLVGPSGEVLGVERVPELAEWGARNLAEMDTPWATIHHAQPGVLGLPEHGPFDRILVSAEAEDLPQPLVDQLASPGRMVIPVRGRMVLVTRVRRGDVAVSVHGHYSFVPLIVDPG